jgi:hypothetical protein
MILNLNASGDVRAWRPCCDHMANVARSLQMLGKKTATLRTAQQTSRIRAQCCVQTFKWPVALDSALHDWERAPYDTDRRHQKKQACSSRIM